MKRITGRFGALKTATKSLAKIDGIDYRIGNTDCSIVLAFDHENGIVISTGFYEVDDFRPVTVNRRHFSSDYHDMVCELIEAEVKRDERDDAAEDAYSERNHA